ncbi:MAG: CBS domain-containing protein [Haloarculaceae archaeon]
MDVRDIVSSEYETVDVGTRVAALESQLRESGARAAVVTDDGEYAGVVTLRRLAERGRDPDAKVGGLVWHVARAAPDDDVRRVAGLLIGSQSDLLPVFEDGDLVGVVTTEGLLEAVREFLGVLSVGDVYAADLVTVDPETTLGEALHTFREERITHLPVVADGAAAGVLSVADVMAFGARELGRSQGGSPGEPLQTGGGRSHGGFGERAGELDRLLDLPVENVMSEPVHTTTRDAGLDEAVGAMLEADVSSRVVVDDGRPTGIVTTTDALRALTWTDERPFPIQITNVDLLDDLSRADVAEMIERVTRKYGDLSVLEANVYLHEHDETLRGTSLLLARVRLFTDRGHFVGTGEGYGASHALRLACNVLERQLLEGKAFGRTKKHPDEDYWSKFFGWWLTGEPRQR